MHPDYTWKYPEVSNPKEWLELGLICHLNIKHRKRGLGLLGEASYGMVTRKSMVDKSCLVKFVMWI